MRTLYEVIHESVREGELYEKLDRNWVRCFACGHCCKIPDGQPGVCKVRYNRSGTLYVPWGYVGGIQCDPIEKKPFFHAHPGALAYSFGMLGCDLHCSYCQNWVTSQALRDPAAVVGPMHVTPTDLVHNAIRQGGRVIVSTYNEPLMRAAEIGKRAGLRYVYAGNLPGIVGDWENTRCPNCQELLIERYGYLITGYFLTPQGCCPSCGASIPGRWDLAFQRQITASPFAPRMRPQSDLPVLNS